MAGYVDYKTAEDPVDANRPSPSIWADCPVITMLRDPGKGFHIFDDFLTLSCQDATTESGTLWYPFLDTCTLTLVAAKEKGVLDMDLADTQDDQATIITGDNTAGCVKITSLDKTKFWFEVNVAFGSITAASQSMFIGLQIPGQAADSKIITDAHALQDVDYIGFAILAADADKILVVHNDNALGTQQSETLKDEIVAGTYYNLGMKFIPAENKIYCYIDGVHVPGCDIDCSTVNFPTGTSFAIALSTKAEDGTPTNMLVDWVRVAQEYRV